MNIKVKRVQLGFLEPLPWQTSGGGGARAPDSERNIDRSCNGCWRRRRRGAEKREGGFGRRRSRNGREKFRPLLLTFGDGPGSQSGRRRADEASGRQRKVRSAAAMPSPGWGLGFCSSRLALLLRQRTECDGDCRVQTAGETKEKGRGWAGPYIKLQKCMLSSQLTHIAMCCKTFGFPKKRL
jgi:hypothetical protein